MSKPSSSACRQTLCRTGLLLGSALIVAATAAAQDVGVPATLPAPRWLRVVADDVNIRTRADLNSMIAVQVQRDTVLEAVGREYDWYRIRAPRGAFSVVAAEYVQRVGPDRGIVTVSEGTLRVRVGSTVSDTNPMTHEVQTRLPGGAEVRIVGEQDGWLRIVPPDDVYFYVSADLVEPISEEYARQLQGAALRGPLPPPATAPAVTRPVDTTGQPAEGEPAEPPQTQPSSGVNLTGTWGQRLRVIERWIAAERAKPAGEQNWSAVLAQLQIVAQESTDPQVVELANRWARDITASQAGPRPVSPPATAGAGAPAAPSPAPAAAPQEARSGQFDAQGVLHPAFAIPAGEHGLRYRLVDPVTRQPRAYVEFPYTLPVRPNAAVGRYVGIRGEIVPGTDFGVPLYRATHLTVFEPDRPQRPPREQP